MFFLQLISMIDRRSNEKNAYLKMLHVFTIYDLL